MATFYYCNSSANEFLAHQQGAEWTENTLSWMTWDSSMTGNYVATIFNPLEGWYDFQQDGDAPLDNHDATTALKHQNQKEEHASSINHDNSHEAPIVQSQIDRVPEQYQRLRIQFGKWGIPSTNFHQFNRTGFCGLQSCLDNSYCIAMIQQLYYQKDMREMALEHSCHADQCLVCELSFLFHMMDQSPGLLCQPDNFLRSLRTHPEAIAQGLVFSNDWDSVNVSQMSGVVQAWRQFILDQFDGFVVDNRFSRLCKVQGVNVTKCSHCRGFFGVESDNTNGCDLVYSLGTGPEHNGKKASFEDLLCSSLNSPQVLAEPRWCGRCRRFQTPNTTRQIQCLPTSLSVNMGLDKRRDNLLTWQEQCAQLASACSDDGQSWIPEHLTLRRLANGALKGGATELGASDQLLELAQYDLQSVCLTICDPGTGQALNVVAAINVGPFYHARVGSPVSQWYLFNGYSIAPICVSELLGLNVDWRIPTTLVYQRRGVNHPLPKETPTIPATHPPKQKHPIGFDIFHPSRGQGLPTTFCPLEESELPVAGDLVALDAEFVTLKPEVKSVGLDGRLSITKPVQRAVARVTCVRGSGPLCGVPFIDDHISCEEEIHDYVTKYSGIRPGDLDPQMSSKYLTSLKTTYKKILYLVDAGCIFVGHGLKNDFGMLNVVVPPEQVVDTVHLFHLPNQRLLSLKFLAWYFLGKYIQGGNHDSAEDAVTALELYQEYRQFQAQQVMDQVLNALYEQARFCQWTVPEPT